MSTALQDPQQVPGVVVLDERRHRFHRRAFLVASLVPLAGFAIAMWSLWGRGFSGADLGIFLAFYAFTGLGVTVGFHRMLAHKAFDAPKPVRAVLAVAGSMSIEMGAIDWVATHRRHHAYADMPGDPHSPHLSEDEGLRGVLRGLWHAHMGWLLSDERSDRNRWAPELMREPMMVRVNALFPLWVTLSFVLPAVAGLLLTGTLAGAVTGFVWGALARIFLLHHVTFSINSICHYFGRRDYDTKEESTNVWPLAILSFGESWHNNHHAYPTSAYLGHKGWQLDPGAWLIRALAAVGLARKLKTPRS